MQNESNSFINKKTNRDDIKYRYYCSLCGALSMLISAPLEMLPRRRTDDSLICLLDKIDIDNQLNQSRLIIIHRGSNKYEKQYTYTCKNCGTFIAYQSTEFGDKGSYDETKRKQLELFNKKIKKIIYFLSDALVQDPQQSSLFIEIDKIKSGKGNCGLMNNNNNNNNNKSSINTIPHGNGIINKGYLNVRIKKSN